MTRGWKIALAASLAANLFLVGAAAGVVIVGGRVLSERADNRRGGQGIGAAFRALPEEQRRRLGAMMREQGMEARPHLRAAREARREASRLIAAPAYDAAAVAAALGRAREAEGRARARIDAALATRLGQLTVEERALFARVMMRGRGERMGGGREGDRDRGDRGRDGRDRGDAGPGGA